MSGTQEEHRARLLALREELNAPTEARAADARPVDLEEPIGRLSRMDALQQQQMAAAQERRRLQRLALVEAALRRIEEGSFGECVLCGEEIPTERLRVAPEVPLCMACQRRKE